MVPIPNLGGATIHLPPWNTYSPVCTYLISSWGTGLTTALPSS